MGDDRKFYKKYNVIFLLLIILIIFSVLTFFNYEDVLSTEEYKELDSTVIKKVIDGDTVQTSSGTTIRLLGVDTPEINWEENTADFYGYKARKFTQKKLKGEQVYLEFDKEKQDDYGRTLAYLYLEDGSLFNKQLLEKGYAHIMVVKPNDKYADKFKKTSMNAREKNLGIWDRLNKLKRQLPVISWKEAEKYYGKKVVVKGKIVDTYKSDEVTFLNFSENYQETLTVVIFNENLNKFAFSPVKLLQGKEIKVLGEIKEYEGTPEIVVEEPTAICFEQ